MSVSSRGASASFGDSDVLYALLERIGFALGRKDFAVSGEQTGRSVKNLAMMVETGAQLVRIGGITGQNGIATDDAAFDLVEPDDAPELDVLAEFALADNGRVRLKQTDELIASRDALAIQHATGGLAHDLLDARHHVRQVVGQTSSARGCPLL